MESHSARIKCWCKRFTTIWRDIIAVYYAIYYHNMRIVLQYDMIYHNIIQHIIAISCNNIAIEWKTTVIILLYTITCYQKVSCLKAHEITYSVAACGCRLSVNIMQQYCNVVKQFYDII